MTADTIIIHGKPFRKIISSRKIQRAIGQLAKKIEKDCKGQKPVFLSVLNGSFLYTADLLRRVKCECEVSFIKIASYSGTSFSGNTLVLFGVNENLKDRTVIVLEDIVDSGNTLEKVMEEIQKHKPREIKIAALFFKDEAYKKKIKLDYVGMKAPNQFLLGYGLDYDGLGRNLEDVYALV